MKRLQIVFLLLLTVFIGHGQKEFQRNISAYQDVLIKSGYSNDDMNDIIVSAQHISSTTKTHHIYFQQRFEGVEIYNAVGSMHILPNGKLLRSTSNFVKNLSALDKTFSPTIEPQTAIEVAARDLGLDIEVALNRIEGPTGKDLKQLYTDGGVSNSEIPVNLAFYSSENTLKLAWSLVIDAQIDDHMWHIFVDAQTGQILDRISWTISCFNSECNHDHDKEHDHEHLHNKKTHATSLAGESYRVYPMPVESPAHGNRQLVVDPQDAIASPFGWHDTDGNAGEEFTTTRGNNCNAYEDGNNDGYQPNDEDLIFDYPVDTNYQAGVSESEDAVITNLFYWNNICHDLWYQYGFDEAAGNFQDNNYGNGGIGGDHVNAEAQDGSGTCNANFSTPTDGGNGRMQMYVCGDRDGDLDNGVIVHEFGHGVSIRLTGGPGTSGCLNNQEQMGEGWSDYLALMMTIEDGDMGEDARGIGTWLFGEGPNGPGIRPFPYSTDLEVNPQTYDHIQSVSIPHGVGSVWCTMLWEMTWALINEYGFDPDFYYGTGGNNMAMALVIEGMKLQPCNPGFVDGRDAILAADVALNGGANQCLIWEAFSKRGLGFSANQGSSNSRADGTESFDLPVFCQDPIIAFTQTEILIPEANAFQSPGDTTGCQVFTDYNVYVNLSIAASDTVDVQVRVDSASASTMVDYVLLDSMLRFGEPGEQFVRLRIFDDGAIEPNEHIFLGLSILNAGATDALTSQDSTSRIIIEDNDIPPGVLVQQFILFADFELSDFGFTSQNSGGDDWERGTVANASSQFWPVISNGSDTIFFVNDDACDCDMSDVRLISPILDITSIISPILTANIFFEENTYQGNTEQAYLMVSTDGGGSYTYVDTLYGLSNQWRRDTFDLSAYAGENDLRIAFRYTDAGGWLYGFAIDDVEVSGKVSNDPIVAIDTMGIDEQYVVANSEVYFHDDNGRLIARLINGSQDLGCVSLSIDRNGLTTNMLWDDSTHHRVFSKTFLAIPEVRNDEAEYNITFYFTSDEVAVWEGVTGVTFDQAKIIKNPLPIYTITPAEPEPGGMGTIEMAVDSVGPTSYGPTTYFISADFSTGFSGFAVGAPGPVPPYCPETYVVPYIPTVDGTYEAQSQLSATGLVPANGVVEFIAGQEVLLLPNFEVAPGGVLEVNMGDCP